MSETATFLASPIGRRFSEAYDALVNRWPPDTRRFDLASPYGNTHVVASGPDSGRPLVLLSGSGATLTEWYSVIGQLSRRHRVYAVDIPGQVGASTPSSTPISSVPDLLDWLAVTVATLGIDEPTLIGHSYGAMIALAFAGGGFSTDGLILVEPNSVFGGMRPEYLAHALPILLSPNENRERRFLEWETGCRPLDEQWSDVAALGATMPTTKLVIPRRLRSVRPEVRRRTVILAEQSRVHDVARIAENVHSTWPGTQVEIVADATHHSLPMYPDVFGDVLEAALDESGC